MLNFTTLNHFLLVAWPCNACYFNKPYNHIAHIIFYTQSKRLLLFPLQFRPWEVCSLDDPWSFAVSHSLMYIINRRTWKASHYCIIIIMMASIMRVSYKLVFHQSKCISAIKRIHCTTATYISSSSSSWRSALQPRWPLVLCGLQLPHAF